MDKLAYWLAWITPILFKWAGLIAGFGLGVFLVGIALVACLAVLTWVLGWVLAVLTDDLE